MVTFDLEGWSPEAKRAFILSLFNDFKEAKRRKHWWQRISLKITTIQEELEYGEEG